jgi:hypothetical protein
MYTQNYITQYDEYTTSYKVCKATKLGAVIGSKFYASETVMPDGTLVESAEVVSAKLDRKAKSMKALCNADAKRQAAREQMMAEGWL